MRALAAFAKEFEAALDRDAQGEPAHDTPRIHFQEVLQRQLLPALAIRDHRSGAQGGAQGRRRLAGG